MPVHPVRPWVLSRYSGFLSPFKNIPVRLIDDYKLSLGVSLSVDGCVSRLSLCGPVMDWRPDQGVLLSRPMTVRIISGPQRPSIGLRRYRKWMDGWIIM